MVLLVFFVVVLHVPKVQNVYVHFEKQPLPWLLWQAKEVPTQPKWEAVSEIAPLTIHKTRSILQSFQK